MIVLISGAKKNVGDYLIVDRAYKLLNNFVDDEIIILSRFQNFNDKIDLLNKSKAIILGGGPAYKSDFYSVYPFFESYDKIRTPIIPMGLGWNGSPFNGYNDFVFNQKSQNILSSIHRKIKFSSCRDIITKSILNNHDINNVLMTGCPVWYDLDYIGKKLPDKYSIKKVVITTGAKPGLLLNTIRLIGMVKEHFPKAQIFLSFHRGVLPSKHTPPRRGISYTMQSIYGILNNLKIKDVSGDLKKLNFYDTCDLHIGYRVHAHLYFLSHRKPSILINEDGRGLGMVKSLDLPIFNFDQKNLIESIENQIDSYLTENFKSFNASFKKIDESFDVMKQFLNTIQ